MFVDDEPALATPAQLLLTKMGYDVNATTDPMVALAAITAEPEGYSALVTDSRMPRMSGIELMTSVRKLAPWIAMVLCAGSLGPDERRAAQGLGAGILNKPYTGEQLARAVEEAKAAHAARGGGDVPTPRA